MDRHDAPSELLFGLLALNNDLIGQSDLVTALHDPAGRPVADALVATGALTAPQRDLIEALAGEQVKRHGGDVDRSLADLTAGPSTRERLARLGDQKLTSSFARVAGTLPFDGDQDPSRTRTFAAGGVAFSAGTLTSDGRRFRVLRPHARGGLGEVFVALDTELNREVALKEIQDRHADDPASRSRFLVEAEITGGLEHPGIVPVYGLGTYANGRPFYAMRFIRGDSLKEAIATFHADGLLKRDRGKRALALRKLLRRFLDVCNAIDYAHSRGVLHRDLKPGNIMIGKHGETLVVDWGLAKATGKSDTSGEEATLIPSLATGSAETLPGSILGTPAYMSPEQARGDSERLGPRSDVYSLGATFYYLLTGKPPVENDDIHSVLRAVQKGELRPPRQLEPSTDKALEAVCLKAMALKEADRYSTPRALAEDIERWTADEPVSAFREGLLPRILRWMRRHPAAVPLASFIALCDGIVLFTVFAIILSSRDIRISPFVVFAVFIIYFIPSIGVGLQCGALVGGGVGSALGVIRWRTMRELRRGGITGIKIGAVCGTLLGAILGGIIALRVAMDFF